MDTENTKLEHLTSLPLVPVDGMRHIVKHDGTEEAITQESFDEWYRLAPIEDYLDTVTKENKDGTKTITYCVAPIYFARALADRFMPISFANKTYVYSKDTSLYSEDTGELKSWVRKQIEFAVMDDKLSNSTKPESIVKEVVGQAAGLNVIGIDEYPFNMYDGVPVNNCVIKFREDGTIETETYRPDMRYTHKIPWDYNPFADPKIAETVLRMWLDDKWEWLVQIPAQAIVQSLPGYDPFKQAYMIIGEHDSGKSTYNGMIQCFFGRGNVSTKSLQSFNERFAKGDLVDMWVNFGDDLTTFRVEDGNDFKSIIGLAETTVEQKYRDSFKARLTAVHAYSANALPELDDAMYSDVAWWSRWAIIEFGNHFDRDPAWKVKHLTQDFYEGFMLLVLDKACEIIRNRRLPLTQDWHDVKQAWIGSSSKFHEFLEVSVEEEKGALLNKQALLDAMNDWAYNYMPVPQYLHDEESISQWRKDQSGRLPDNITMLTKALKMEGITTKQAPPIETQNGDTARIWMYKDIKFKPGVPWAVYPDAEYYGAKQ